MTEHPPSTPWNRADGSIRVKLAFSTVSKAALGSPSTPPSSVLLQQNATHVAKKRSGEETEVRHDLGVYMETLLRNLFFRQLLVRLAAASWVIVSSGPLVGQEGRQGRTEPTSSPTNVSAPVSSTSPVVDLTTTVGRIDELIAQGWRDHKLAPSTEATDGEWCRRVYLDVLGRIPSVGELRKFLADEGPGKQERLVGRLLGLSLDTSKKSRDSTSASGEYEAEFAEEWSSIWTNILIGRTGGMEDNSLTSRDGMRRYLRDCFAERVPYDRMVEELISAEGTTVPDSSEFNGATNFLVDKLADNAILATARSAQIFLGMQVQCTQCHNHPFNDWKQNQFWELNAYFRQTVALRRYESGTDDIREVKLTNQDFGGEGDTPLEAEIYFEPRNGVAQVAYPVFVDGTPLENRSGYIADVNRRKELAKKVVASQQLDEALVNRLWKHFLGYGLSQPVDDLGPHRAVSHPELLRELSTKFRESGRDMRQLMAWITLSKPYALSSKANGGNTKDDPTLGEPPRFSRFYLRQMNAEQLYESLLEATAADQTKQDAAERLQARTAWLRQFTIAFGTDEGDEATTFDGTIPQTLMMFNGELVREATRLDQPTILAQVVASPMRPAAKIEHLYLAALARRPDVKERTLASEIVAAAASAGKGPEWKEGASPGNSDRASYDPVAIAFQDLWWALLNSNEFILIR